MSQDSTICTSCGICNDWLSYGYCSECFELADSLDLCDLRLFRHPRDKTGTSYTYHEYLSDYVVQDSDDVNTVCFYCCGPTMHSVKGAHGMWDYFQGRSEEWSVCEKCKDDTEHDTEQHTERDGDLEWELMGI